MYTVVMKVMKRQYLGNYTRLSDGRDSETSLAAAERQRVSYIRLAGLAHWSCNSLNTAPVVQLYTVGHKKRATFIFTITLANVDRFQ